MDGWKDIESSRIKRRRILDILVGQKTEKNKGNVAAIGITADAMLHLLSTGLLFFFFFFLYIKLNWLILCMKETCSHIDGNRCPSWWLLSTIACAVLARSLARRSMIAYRNSAVRASSIHSHTTTITKQQQQQHFISLISPSLIPFYSHQLDNTFLVVGSWRRRRWWRPPYRIASLYATRWVAKLHIYLYIYIKIQAALIVIHQGKISLPRAPLLCLVCGLSVSTLFFSFSILNSV